jgi:hypothetical protein
MTTRLSKQNFCTGTTMNSSDKSILPMMASVLPIMFLDGTTLDEVSSRIRAKFNDNDPSMPSGILVYSPGTGGKSFVLSLRNALLEQDFGSEFAGCYNLENSQSRSDILTTYNNRVNENWIKPFFMTLKSMEYGGFLADLNGAFLLKV